MHAITTEPHTLFTPAEAERVAGQMQAEDTDGWKYRAVHNPNGEGRQLSYVAIEDSEGEIGRL